MTCAILHLQDGFCPGAPGYSIRHYRAPGRTLAETDNNKNGGHYERNPGRPERACRLDIDRSACAVPGPGPRF
ncbi:conserved hypothetical protein [Pseudomonas protegens Pf-5]|uniref:Uncharacterized protein n=1 Tax=Pseudomonas fluorescens (strain ATCC BAA-477 / NRRL B-23932 / Pf-5) TaxID=220664 RepID=Q4K6Q9_PSEF5|nr:conserved hypothetical protein [Pseudomonas protegens Pf-5]